MEFIKKKVLVVGLGRSGLSTARCLSKVGAEVTVSEMRNMSGLDPNVLRELSELGIALETGCHSAETFLHSDLIILSPGVPVDIAPLEAARRRSIPIMGEMELASRLIHEPLLAVSGTNGKTTTTALLGDMLKRSGHDVFVAGNIGTPLIEYFSSGREAEYIVVEVSSFQLDTMETFQPFISILLNISPDHLDRYPDYEAYIQSKLKLFRNQTGPEQYAILNDDDAILSQYEPGGGISVLRFGLEKQIHRHAFIEGKNLVARLPGLKSYSFPFDQFQLPGKHNLGNLMSVVLTALALDLDAQKIQETIDHWRGLPHRIEFIRRISDVDFINDSKATNVDAAMKAILSFERPIILIAGGRHKGGDYSPLLNAAQGRVRRAIFLGEAKHRLADAFNRSIPFTLAETMDEAVSLAHSFAGPNDVVLLAPACSSFDMFTDYTHRGQIFREAVERIPHAA
ncbi:UDP-N-acetylmuramoyl-L-alanine--D-glutamate ligase [Thermodesulfobacteriota bacterium]